MIIDSIQNASKYHCVHPLFATAFEFILKNDLITREAGTYELQKGLLKAIVAEAPGKTLESALSTFECHNQFIDIQYVISGVEKMGWKPRGDCILPKGDYDEANDVLFFNDSPDTYLNLAAGQFVIFFPGDVHAPMIGEGSIKKLIMKIKV